MADIVTSSDDLVVRLQAAIEVRERAARQAPFDPYKIHVDRPEDGPHIRLHDPASVLRLCQSHRDILEQYKTAEQRPTYLMEDRAHGIKVLEAEAAAKALRLVVEALARGYGIEDQAKAVGK